VSDGITDPREHFRGDRKGVRPLVNNQPVNWDDADPGENDCGPIDTPRWRVNKVKVYSGVFLADQKIYFKERLAVCRYRPGGLSETLQRKLSRISI